MDPSFWNSRFDRDHFVYGTAPNHFIATQQDRLPPGTTVLDLAGGEGRNAVYLAAHGCEVTLLDYSDTALQKAERLAAEQGTALETIHADLTTWTPDRTWQALVATYVHLPVQWQPRLYEMMQASLAPGGTLVAEWFRPEQRTDGYTSGGPPDVEMMVTAQDLRDAFPESGIELLTEPIVPLSEGPGHSGQAAVVRLIWTKPGA
jgi:SAM-dependent methyltransferase